MRLLMRQRYENSQPRRVESKVANHNVRLTERVVQYLDIAHQHRNSNRFDDRFLRRPSSRYLLSVFAISLFPLGQDFRNKTRVTHRMGNPRDVHQIDPHSYNHRFIMSVN